MRGACRVVAALSLLLQGCAAVVVGPEPVLPVGQWSSRPGWPGLVIGVQHRGLDDLIDQISLDLARQTGFGLVVATGSALDRRGFDEAYQLRVREVARGPLRLYVEVHAGSRQKAERRIRIATVGVGRDEAWKLKTLFELIRDARLRSRPEEPRLDVLVEPAQSDAFGATPVALFHVLERGIQIELPRTARTLGREVYTEILAEFLKESSRLLLKTGK